MSKDKEILGILLKTITSRDGEPRVRQIQTEVKKRAFGALDREVICQILALERPFRRFMFLVLCPSYIVPYLIRIRERAVAPSTS